VEEKSWLTHLLVQSWGRKAPPSIWWGSASCCSCEISLQALESTSNISSAFCCFRALMIVHHLVGRSWELPSSLVT